MEKPSLTKSRNSQQTKPKTIRVSVLGQNPVQRRVPPHKKSSKVPAFDHTRWRYSDIGGLSECAQVAFKLPNYEAFVRLHTYLEVAESTTKVMLNMLSTGDDKSIATMLELIEVSSGRNASSMLTDNPLDFFLGLQWSEGREGMKKIRDNPHKKAENIVIAGEILKAIQLLLETRSYAEMREVSSANPFNWNLN